MKIIVQIQYSAFPDLENQSPNWRSIAQFEPNCAKILKVNGTEAILDPLIPNLWLNKVKVGDSLMAFEGKVQIIHAIVVAIISENEDENNK